MTTLVLATANPEKVKEIHPLLAGAGVELVSATDLVPDWKVVEDGETLEANARLKAVAAVEATGMPAVADDTGLFVAALDGAPGVRSARFSGPGATYGSNRALLVERLQGVSDAGRAAEFRTAAVLRHPDGEERVFVGTLAGQIVDRERGEHGFGYDPVFELDDGRTLAEIPLGEKNRLSHRAAAFRAVAAFLSSHPGWLEERRKV